jgi:hypothetical protein
MVFDLSAADPWIWALIASSALIIFGGAAAMVRNVRRVRRQKARNDAVAEAVVSYFRHTGVGIAAGCISLSPNRYTVIIESQPMKRFRLSHIIEATVKDHVKKTCGLEVDKIYWRFPIQQPASVDGKDVKAADHDPYINEGLVNYRHLPKMEVEEMSLEDFEQVSQKLEVQQSGPLEQQEK